MQSVEDLARLKERIVQETQRFRHPGAITGETGARPAMESVRELGSSPEAEPDTNPEVRGYYTQGYSSQGGKAWSSRNQADQY